MIVLALEKIVNFGNSAHSGRIPCKLLAEKQPKSLHKQVYANHFRRTQYLICPKSILLFRFDCHSNTEPHKAISIATS